MAGARLRFPKAWFPPWSFLTPGPPLGVFSCADAQVANKVLTTGENFGPPGKSVLGVEETCDDHRDVVKKDVFAIAR